MPTYAYTCRSCGNSLEVKQAFTDAALTECPVCGGSLRKVFNSVGVVFKGSGFYRNDSRATPDSGSGSPAKDSAAKDSGSKDGAAGAAKESASKDGGSSGSGSGGGAKTESSGSSGSGSSGTSSTKASSPTT